MDKSFALPITLSCATLVMAGLVPSGLAQGYQPVAQLEEGPRSFFDAESEDSLAKFLNWGALNARPHAELKAYYDSNLTLAPEREEEDFVWRISPGVTFGVGQFRGEKGNYVTLDYTMTGSIYTKYSDYNSLDHDVALRAGWKTAKFTADLLQSYTTSHGKQVELGAFVDQELFLTELRTRYDVSEKTFAELNGRQSLVASEAIIRNGPNDELSDVNEWAVEGWFNYKFSEKVTLGAGPTVGWRDIHDHAKPDNVDEIDSPNQTFEQLLVKGTYYLSDKLAFMGASGLQFSQFQGDDDEGPNLVLEAGGTWKAQQNTQLSFNIYRRDQVSYSVVSENYFATGFRLTMQHQFREKYFFTLQGGYENYDYYGTAGPGETDRNDDYFWLSPVLSFQVDDHTLVGVFYQFRDRESDDGGFDFVNHQAGMFARYAF
jgi:hypothetical protein